MHRYVLLNPVLAALPGDDAERVLATLVRRSLTRGEVLHLAGSTGRRVHLVLAGVVKIAIRDADGREEIAHLAVRGDLVGDIGAVDGLGQPFDAIAATRCTLAGFDADVFMETVARNPEAARLLMRALARRTRAVTDSLLERSTKYAPARLAGTLLELSQVLGRTQADGIEFELPVGQTDLARLAGMCRESACKAMNEFRREGILNYRGRSLRIVRPDALRRIRCAGRDAAPSPSKGGEGRRRSRSTPVP